MYSKVLTIDVLLAFPAPFASSTSFHPLEWNIFKRVQYWYCGTDVEF